MRRLNVAVVVALLVGVAGGVLARGAFEGRAQASPAGGGQAGRYQLVGIRSGSSDRMYIIDTTNGKVWEYGFIKSASDASRWTWRPIGQPTMR